MQEHHIAVRRSARYYTIGPNDAAARELWFVLHGYGQLAEQFIRAFEALDDGTRLFVAPEALNRFYTIGVEHVPANERPVGATWMTREDREREIDDYVAYLDAVAAEVIEPFRARGASPRITLLGFSQGTATAGRWVDRGAIRPAQLLLWGGFLAPEIDLSTPDQPVRRTGFYLAIGSTDKLVSPERLAEEESRLRAAGAEYRVIHYVGGHGISRDKLLEVTRALSGAA